jgi:L-asparaginase
VLAPTLAIGRPRLIAWALLVAVLLASPQPAGGSDRQPRVRVVATGGTIANAISGRLTAEELIAGLAHPERLARLEAETFANVPSAALTLDDCARLSRHLVAILTTDPDLDGVVVTTGTDTLEELAWFLYLTVPGDRPVVVTGAMRRPATRDADGPGNLADAVRVAGSRSARGRGTIVVMHGQILPAREVRKRHATDLDAFDAPDSERLGVIRRGRAHLTRGVSTGLAAGSLPLTDERPLPRVDVLLVYQGAAGDLIDAAIANGARGIVLASAGAGALTPSQWDAARRAAGEGVPVVIASRTGDGRVATSGSLIGAGDLAPLKARLLLTLALARGLDAREIAALFATPRQH